MAQEIELKLVVTADDAGRFVDDVARALFPDVEGSTDSLRAIYFDTPDQILRHRGASLRIRRRGGGERVQTVKIDAARGAGLFVRPEWERIVDDDRPVLDDTTPLAALLGDEIAQIGPIFIVAVERTTWRIDDDEADIEMVLDRGSVSAGDRQSPICEIELELKRGSPTALFTLARRIMALTPARIGVVTKSERGYALLGATVTAFKAEPLALDAGMTTAAALQTIVGACLRQYRLNETILLDARAPEALHQARVALRRLRSALKIFNSVLGDRQTARLQTELRTVAHVLGRARDLDVMSKAALARIGPGPIHARIDHARGEAYDAVDAVLTAPLTSQTMLELVAWSVTGDWLDAGETATLRARPVSRFARKVLGKRRKALKTGRVALEDLGPDDRHELRKSAKTLRYSSEFFSTLFHTRRERRHYVKFVATLEKLQDRLGTLNDRATAPAVLQDLDLLDHEDAVELIDHRGTDRLILRAGKAHRKLLDRKRFWD